MPAAMTTAVTPTRAVDDLKDFNEKRRPVNIGELLSFQGMGNRDVYNTSMPFEWNGKTVIAGRVESRDSESATTMFFERTGSANTYVLMPDAARLINLQDPFLTFINGKPILGGVDAIWRDDGSLVTYHTDFYDISDIACPRHIIHGPVRMKDIRLHELPDGRVAVFTRPQGEAMASRMKIAAVGFTVVKDLREVTEELIAAAPLIEWLFNDAEWGGVNQLHTLKNGLIGIVGHKSWGEKVNDVFVIHYYCFASVIHPDTRAISPSKLIAVRDCFPETPVKNARAHDVCFPSGLIRNADGTASLYSGLSDCAEGVVSIHDPFLEYEKR